MNCNECTSQKVCFIQKQIESLADRMVQSPFHEIIDTDGDRTASLISRHTRAVSKQFDVSRKLRKVIASSCPLYLHKDQGINGESSSTGQSTGL